jgi:hypothetical protein
MENKKDERKELTRNKKEDTARQKKRLENISSIDPHKTDTLLEDF